VILQALADAWAAEMKAADPHASWGGYLGPTAQVEVIVERTTDAGELVVVALFRTSSYEYPQSGSGWSDFYARVVEATLKNGVVKSHRVLADDHTHATEWQVDYGGFDHGTVTKALVAEALAKVGG